MGRHPKTFTLPDSCSAANSALFDHLVGARQERFADRREAAEGAGNDDTSLQEIEQPI